MAIHAVFVCDGGDLSVYPTMEAAAALNSLAGLITEPSDLARVIAADGDVHAAAIQG